MNDKKLTNLPQDPEGLSKKRQQKEQEEEIKFDITNIVKKIEEDEAQRLRDQVRVKYDEFIKGSCKHCYGSGTMHLSGKPGVDEYVHPIICICVQKRMDKSAEELLVDLVTGLQNE